MSNFQRGCLVLLAGFLWLAPAGARGQVDTTFTQTAPPTPVGSGARAMGTGGAFIAIADDATAANWNPGGMIQLITPEVSAVYSYDQRWVEGGDARVNALNHASLVYPFNVGGVNVVTSLNYQRLYNFYFQGSTSELVRISDYTVTIADPVGPPPVVFINETRTNYPFSMSSKKTGYLEALSPAVAVEITPQLSLGFAYNFWNDNWMGTSYREEYKEKQGAGETIITNGPYTITGDFSNCTCNGGEPCNDWGDVIDDISCLDSYDEIFPPDTTTFDREEVTIRGREDIDMAGENFTIGLLWKFDPQWTLGLVYRSEFGLKQKRRVTYSYAGFDPPRDKFKWSYDETLRMPASYGIGLAYRYSDELSFAFDATRIEWNRFQLELDGGDKISPVNGLPVKDADISPTMTYRLGMEYLVIQPRYVVPLRCGFFYDPEPDQGRPDDYYGVAAGGGLVYDRFILDFAYWYRWGNDVTLYTNYDRATGDYEKVKGDVGQQMFMVSIVMHVQ